MSARCRSCDAEIVWAITAGKGRLMPFDLTPVEAPKGAFVLAHGREGDERVAITAQWFFAGTSPLIEHLPAFYVSHFATCPNAAQHRGAR